MVWNITAECISMVILSIVWIYSRRGNFLPTLRNKLVQACFFITMCAMVSNVLSTVMIANYDTVHLLLNQVVTTVYFLCTPIVGFCYFSYTASVIIKDEARTEKFIFFTSFPVLIYIILIILNPITGGMFSITAAAGYVRGPLIITTYIIFYIYCLLCVIISFFNIIHTTTTERRILTAFPILAVVVIVFQQYFSNYSLSGSAATCAMIIIYLYLENKQIYFDYLTGLPNRKMLLDMLACRVHGNKKVDPLTLLVFSVKDFKKINNKFGHHGGNLLLMDLANFLKTITPPECIYRFGGDEFAILMGESTTGINVESIIYKIRLRMAQPWVQGQCNYQVAAAMGIVQYQKDIDTVENIINGVEYAVLQAKKDAIYGFMYCTPAMVAAINRRDEVVEILRNAIKYDSLEVYFQPIYDLKYERFYIAESLSRLIDTPLGFISPGEFVPLAEDSGLIIPMTYAVLEKSCKFARSLMDAGVEFNGISVNFSAAQFDDKDFTQKMLEILDRHGMPYSKIKIEITEGIIARSFDEIKDFMQEMHTKGILFGLDDFGTGYSNISSVLQLPWDTIKLDKSFVWSAMQDHNCAVLLDHVTNAFSTLNIRILAEGVETIEQRDYCRSIGCQMIQGYLYARPMPASEALKIMGKSHQEVLEALEA